MHAWGMRWTLSLASVIAQSRAQAQVQHTLAQHLEQVRAGDTEENSFRGGGLVAFLRDVSADVVLQHDRPNFLLQDARQCTFASAGLGRRPRSITFPWHGNVVASPCRLLSLLP